MPAPWNDQYKARRKKKPLPKHLVTTTPKRGRCSKCHAPVLQCMAHGEPTSLENVHLSLHGEAKALIMGIWTYNLTIHGDGHPFNRAVYHIKSGLPKHSYIVPAHRCGVTWHAATDLDTRQIERQFGIGVQPDECPF